MSVLMVFFKFECPVSFGNTFISAVKWIAKPFQYILQKSHLQFDFLLNNSHQSLFCINSLWGVPYTFLCFKIWKYDSYYSTNDITIFAYWIVIGFRSCICYMDAMSLILMHGRQKPKRTEIKRHSSPLSSCITLTHTEIHHPAVASQVFNSLASPTKHSHQQKTLVRGLD